MVAICSPDHHSDELEAAFAGRPALRVIEGGRAPRSRAAQVVYVRRRLVALALLALVVVVLAAAVERAGLLGDGGGQPATSAVPVDAAPVGRVVHVVQPGDTLWTIARAIAPQRDPRAVVDQLVELNGDAPIEVGQRLALPAS